MNGTTLISYAYNADGLRISKAVGGVTYNYVYAGSTLTDVTWGSNSMHFVYDALGASAVIYNGTTYYYLRNAQGGVRMQDLFSITMTDAQLQAMSSIALAHVGDAVYELLVRGYLCCNGKATGKGMHRATVELVCAGRQAALSRVIMALLTPEEADVFRRGRNANVHAAPHNASMSDYRYATALEALFGWLWLQGKKDRLLSLFDAMMEEVR